MTVSEALVRMVKPSIESGDLEHLQEVLEAYYTSETYTHMLAWDYILLKLYIHSCLKHQAVIATWILEQTNRLTPIEQSAIRHMIPYGRWLLSH